MGGIHLELTGPQYRDLSAALRTRFTVPQFDRMLKTRLDVNRQNISLQPDYVSIVFDVIDEANRGSWVYKLVNAAREERPNEPIFVEYARIVKIGPEATPDAAQLQGIINASNALLNVAVFRSRLGEIEGQVCRVDIDGAGEGTGFLIGPNAVLTNYHVVESLIKQQRTFDHFTCRFDFKVREDGTSVNKGTVVNLAGPPQAFSPYDPADLTSDAADPQRANVQTDPANLDYCLLELADAVGNLPIGSNASESADTRNWIPLTDRAYPFGVNTPLFIVQHPSTKPLKLAMNTQSIIGMTANRMRVVHRTNTDHGSSGSPCFDQNWNLVALHHSGDTNWVPAWNEGIPMPLILKDIQTKGFGNLVG